jgi:hypothetical protein
VWRGLFELFEEEFAARVFGYDLSIGVKVNSEVLGFMLHILL